jgi:hypothetical protein
MYYCVPDLQIFRTDPRPDPDPTESGSNLVTYEENYQFSSNMNTSEHFLKVLLGF